MPLLPYLPDADGADLRFEENNVFHRIGRSIFKQDEILVEPEAFDAGDLKPP